MAVEERPTAFYLWARFFDLLRLAIVYGLYAWLAYMAYRSIEALAGKITRTDLDVAISYFTSKDNDYGICWLVAFICLIWAILERRFRLRKTTGMAEEIKQLQLRLDPSRTTSGLLPTGETNPEDRTL